MVTFLLALRGKDLSIGFSLYGADCFVVEDFLCTFGTFLTLSYGGEGEGFGKAPLHGDGVWR